MTGFSARRVAALIAIPVVLIACAVFATATIERASALHSGTQADAGHRLLTAMLDQETGSRGYFETRETSFLEPWYEGQAEFTAALAQARSLSTGDAPLIQLLNQQAERSGIWRAAVAVQIARLRTTGRRPSIPAAVFEKSLMDDFRQLNSLYDTQLTTQRDRTLSLATWLAAAVAALLSIVLVVAGIVLVHRTTRRENVRLRRQQELRELLQVSGSEAESQLLLIRHVLRLVPGSGAAVLNRNNSGDDRLEPKLSEGSEQTPLRDLVVDGLRPRSCMAVRLSHPHRRVPGEESLLRCEACGKIEAEVICEPLLVGGQVIGSVLVTREQPIGTAEVEGVHESVVQAAPIVANQRNLALAERRAASDALTGLPNRRAADEAIKRMAAQAGRSVSPLSVVLLDLDHFKLVNDVHGHERGDKTLAAVGQILAANVRTSDFAARYGGEEFLLLLPDTDRGGAVEVAEKLRQTIERAEIREVGGLTASFGIATMPDDAVEPETLIRRADRALYAAKSHGRNRIEVAAPPGGQDLPGDELPRDELPRDELPGSDGPEA
jgi:diguanylate cyclase (GGDEF)-like protein